MRPSSVKLACSLALLVPSLLSQTAGSASADWPMQRHDARRTATGTGSSRIDRPAIAMRYYLGGSLGQDQYVTHDVDGDGAPEVVFVLGGAIVAKTPRDVVVWETPALDAFRIDGVVDLDGDGAPEIVASARAGRVHVIDPATGAVRWSMPSGVVGNVGAIRFAALDSMAGLDLYVAEAACGSTGALGDVGRAYSFAGGLASPTAIFDLERGRRDYVCGVNDTIADVDGDGTLEVVVQGTRTFYVYSGVDGHLISASEDVGSIPYGTAQVFLAQADEDAPLELVCFTENTYAAPANSRRVFLMDWDATAARLVRRWERSAVDVTNDRHGWFPGGVEDLGDDGRVEVVTSFYSAAAGAWTTLVLDVRDGTEVATLSRGPFAGLADLDGDGSSEVIVGDAASGLGAYRLAGTTLTRLFLQTGLGVVRVRDRSDVGWPSAPRSVPLALDLDGDARAELFAVRSNPDRTSSLLALSAATDPPTEVARLDVEAGVSMLAFQPFPNVTRPRVQPLVVRSDGYLWILDEELRATNADLGGEIPERGLRVGGYYSGPSGVAGAPIAADLDGDGADDVVIRDSRGFVQRLDAQSATLVEPPAVTFETPGGWSAIVELTGAAPPELVIAGNDWIAAYREDGTTLWRTTVGTAARTMGGDLVPGDVTGDGTPDIVFQLQSSSGGTVLINVLDGTTGARVWAADYETVVAGSGLGTSGLHDRDGDGRLDVLATPRNLFAWLSAIDGTAIATVDAGYPAHPLFHDVDGDGALEILSPGGVYGINAFEVDLARIWGDTTGLHTRVIGAIATCGGVPRVLQAHYASPRITAWDARTGAIVGDLAMLDGRVHEPPSAAPDQPGVLGNVTIAPDLTGGGTPTALVPSTDGHLYALDPCTLALRWALDLRYPVGEATLADPDGDGEDEILVTAADGFLYAIGREVLPAPAWVYENDGSGPAASEAEDVDELATSTRLWANWAPVAGATAYEYAVITPGGAFLTSPSFVNVGAATSVEALDLPLRVGQRYLFAVRAIGAEGTSSEALSDGVVVIPDPCDACGPGQICVDEVCVPDPCAGTMCPPGLTCVMGACVERDGGAPDAGVRADGGTAPVPSTGGGCCSVAAGVGRGRAPVELLGLGLLGLALGLVALRRRRG